MGLQLVTVETRVSKAKRGRGGPTNIGEGHSWEGWTTKTKILSEWFDKHEDDGTLIIFADNQDMFFGGCGEMQFMMDYNFALASKPGARTVIGAERGCFDVPPPWNCDNVPETPTWAQRNWTVAASDNPHHVIYDSPVEKHGQMRYPNSGFIIGTVAVLRDLFKTALDDMKKEPLSQGRPAPGHAFTDQFFVTRYVLGHPDKIAFDYGSSLVTNGYSLDARKLFDLLPMGVLRNRVTQKRQCFFHANGPAEETAAGIAKWQEKFEKA
uniref:Uncharacterized protein n=1 Tax=Alexandrium andersonii TaxID=327968 RepID=A0A7S2NF36_9DINO|mmetsp:Transcript_93542/g.209420  ORF Transcript_93542/g.209420 Transcript_93542/m.209420 type:complete len:267 (+) Transcript_93542:2-802(+)